MNSLVTLVALAAVQALFLLLGLGITARVPALRRTGWAVALAPLVGHLALIVLALGLNVRMLRGGPSVLVGAALLLLFTASAPRAVWEASAGFARSRTLWRLALLALAVQILNAGGLLAAGFETYNGNANLDAWFYAQDTELLQGRRYFEPVLPERLRPLLYTIPPPARVGAQLSVLLVARILPLDMVQAFNLTLGSLVPLVCVAAAYFVREGMRLRWRWALLAAGLAGIHSSLSVAYLNQHLGHVLALAVIPVAVTAVSRCSRHGPPSAAFAGFVATAGLFAYWPTMPLMAIPIALVAAAHARRRLVAARMVAPFLVTTLAVILLASPAVLSESLHSVARARRSAARNDPALLAFNPYLTEELLPISAGLVHPGALTAFHLEKGLVPATRVYPHIAAFHALALAVMAFALIGVVTEVQRGRPLLPALLGTAVALLATMVHGEYGYGVYKMTSWMHVALVAALVAGVARAWTGQRSGAWRLASALVIVLFVVFNVRATIQRVYASVVGQPDTYLAGPLFARNLDWHQMERWSAEAPGPILVGLHPHVAQYWASWRLRHSGYTLLVPQDTLGAASVAAQAHHDALAEVPDALAPLELDPLAVFASRLFLDWARPIDVTRNTLPAAVARNGTFALYRTEDVAGFLSVREGWHSLEPFDPAHRGTSAFRWMSSRASLLFFRFAARPIRLMLGVQSGYGLPTLDRRITVWHRGRPLAAFDVEGTGRIVTPPFVARAPFDEVVLEVAGQPRPMARPFTLWNRWVQHDPRVLALGVSDVETRPEGQALGPDGEIARRWSPEEIRARFLYDGLHADDWIGRRFVVTVPTRARSARVGLADFGGPQPIRVTVDGAVRVANLQPSQPQIVDVDLTGLAPGDGHVIALEFTRWHEQGTTSRPDLDRRREAARLLWLDLQ